MCLHSLNGDYPQNTILLMLTIKLRVTFPLALSQASHFARRSLLSIDETDDSESLDVLRLCAACMTITFNFGSVLWLLGESQAVSHRTLDVGCIGSKEVESWHGTSVSHQLAKDK